MKYIVGCIKLHHTKLSEMKDGIDLFQLTLELNPSRHFLYTRHYLYLEQVLEM
jgi:hypothetical protein